MQVQELEQIKTSRLESADGMIVKRVLAGHQEAFEILVCRYQKPLFNFICHYVGDYDLACDITQNVFVQLFISLPTLRTERPLKSWLYQVARNRCLDELRRRNATPFSHFERVEDDEELSPLAILQDTNPLPDEISERQEVQRILRQAIDGLPPKYRAVVLLRYIGQLSFSEIGAVLHMPEATAKTYFQRSRPLLRAALVFPLSISF